MKYLMDTHTWIWWKIHPQKLSKKVSSIIEYPEDSDELLLSAISVWEFSKLLVKKRIEISISPEEWIENALEIQKFRLVPLSPMIAYRSTTLPQPFHQDPSDQIIVATAIEEDATLLTKDEALLNYQHVMSVW